MVFTDGTSYATPAKITDPSTDPDIATDRIEGDVACLQRRSERAARAPQEGLGASDEFGHGERLDQVVVRPSVQPAYAIQSLPATSVNMVPPPEMM